MLTPIGNVVITIRKYANRRLYDTSKSQYVNIDFVKQLVLNHKEFRVVDAKSENDLTKSILLQIITEQEGDDEQSVLTNTVLKQLIRFYGSDLQVFIRPYLENSIATFLERQDSMQDFIKEMLGTTALESMTRLFEENLEAWNQFTFGDSSPKDGD